MNKLNSKNYINNSILNITGNIELNICNKYFYAKNNIYPNYSNKEYAILLSHLSVIEKCSLTVNNKYNVALICEDDISLDFMKYWKNDFKSIIEKAPFNWEIIMLGYFSLNIDKKNLYNKWDNEWSAMSYLINNKTIKNKINSLKKDNLWICDENDLMVSDNYIFSKFNTYVYKYPYFTFPNNNDSTLHQDHLNYHKIYKISNYIVNENIKYLYMPNI
jgi:GR25 family glycosyltransferase involved in LPS biosynthesis